MADADKHFVTKLLREMRPLFPKLKMKLKGLHFADVSKFQEAVTDELKKVQKEEFSATFQKMYDCAKPVYTPMELILNEKKVSFSCVFDF